MKMKEDPEPSQCRLSCNPSEGQQSLWGWRCGHSGGREGALELEESVDLTAPQEFPVPCHPVPSSRRLGPTVLSRQLSPFGPAPLCLTRHRCHWDGFVPHPTIRRLGALIDLSFQETRRHRHLPSPSCPPAPFMNSPDGSLCTPDPVSQARHKVTCLGLQKCRGEATTVTQC